MRAEHDTLEVLCLNAGRGGAKGDPRDETDGMESIMLTNVYGHFLLAAELMPLLKAANDGARIVTQSSGARNFAIPEKVIAYTIVYLARKHLSLGDVGVGLIVSR